MLYGLLNEFVIGSNADGGDLARAKPYLDHFAPSMMSVLDRLRYSRIETLVPALRSAAADDIRRIPAQLLNYPDSAIHAHNLLRFYGALETIKIGVPPDLALSRSRPSKSGDKCDTLTIVQRFATEWYLSKRRVEQGSGQPWDMPIQVGGYTLSTVLEQPELIDRFIAKLIHPLIEKESTDRSQIVRCRRQRPQKVVYLTMHCRLI